MCRNSANKVPDPAELQCPIRSPVGAVSNPGLDLSDRTASAQLETLLVPTGRDSALRNPIYRGAPTKQENGRCGFLTAPVGSVSL